jgi:hypothetical protein
MMVFGKTLRNGITAALLLAGLSGGAHAQVAIGGFGVPFGGAGREISQITGKVVCTGCNLEEVRKVQPGQNHLYQFNHKRGQLVMEVSSVDDAHRWRTLAWPPRLWIRTSDQLLQKLTAEENLFKEVGITGIIGNSRTLDVFDVMVHG